MASVTPSQYAEYQQHASDNRQGELYATAICTLILCWTFVILRFFARWKISAGFKSDDWFVVAAAVAFTAFPIGIFLLNSVGFGKHIIFVTNPKAMVEMVVLCEISYSVTIPLTKLSILSLYNRIFPSATLFRVSAAIAIITIIYSLALAVVCILQCVPLSTLWGGSDGFCLDTTPPYTATAVANVVTDIAVLCLPMPFLYRLNMPVQRKLQLVAVFGLGGCVCIFGVVRSISVGTASSVDQSWTTVNGTIWSAVEPCVGIICACLPTMRGLIPSSRNHHTGYTEDGQPNNRFGSRFGWTAGRRRNLHSSTMLGRVGGAGGVSSAAGSTKPQVWSTVTSGLQSSSVERTKTEREVDERSFAWDDNGHQASGRCSPPIEKTLASGKWPRSEQAGGSRTDTPSIRKPSISDIHVRTEVHQEISQVDGDA